MARRLRVLLSRNPVFWWKVGCFALAGLLSVPPTICFIRWSRAFAGNGALPDAAEWLTTRKLVGGELHALSGVMICAALMGAGIGHQLI